MFFEMFVKNLLPRSRDDRHSLTKAIHPKGGYLLKNRKFFEEQQTVPSGSVSVN